MHFAATVGGAAQGRFTPAYARPATGYPPTIEALTPGLTRGSASPSPAQSTPHRALFIGDPYVIANELTHRPALFAAERQNDAIAFFRLASGIKANYE